MSYATRFLVRFCTVSIVCILFSTYHVKPLWQSLDTLLGDAQSAQLDRLLEKQQQPEQQPQQQQPPQQIRQLENADYSNKNNAVNVSSVSPLNDLQTVTLINTDQHNHSNASFPSTNTTPVDSQNDVDINNVTIHELGIDIPIDPRAVDIRFWEPPHAGVATPNVVTHDVHGNEGYIPDVTLLRQNPPPFSLDGAEIAKVCEIHDDHWQVFRNRLRLVKTSPRQRQQQQNRTNNSTAKILCIVYSTETNHETILPAILETWASRCDGFMVASNKTDPAVHAVNVIRGKQDGTNLYGWQAIRSIWSFVYHHYYDPFDWFHVGGENMWVIPENLRAYLDSTEVQAAAAAAAVSANSTNGTYNNSRFQIPLYLGATSLAHKTNLDSAYQLAGPGYTLNKAALKLLVTKGLPHYKPKEQSTQHDKMLAETFRSLGVSTFRATTLDGSVYYNHFPPGTHYYGREDYWYHRNTAALNYTRNAKHSAVHSVSFHDVSPDDMRRFHALLYGLCGPFPPRPPPMPTLGRYSSDSAWPFLSVDVWHELVDYNRSFFVRPEFTDEFATERGWIEWLDAMPWSVKLVMNNNFDWPWPHEQISMTPPVLEHANLERLYVMNPNIVHPKVSPLPIGPKWQWFSSMLYGERKDEFYQIYSSVSTSPDQTKALFESPNRTNTVWVRPVSNSQRRITYEQPNKALKTHRHHICSILSGTAPSSTVCEQNEWVNQTEYFEQLTKHRFVTSPAGRGLDTHATWEALLAGCIPIVPRSLLAPMLEDLPVWLVDSWEEVTDEALLAKSQEYLNASNNSFDWNRIFAEGWKKELRKFHDNW